MVLVEVAGVEALISRELAVAAAAELFCLLVPGQSRLQALSVRRVAIVEIQAVLDLVAPAGVVPAAQFELLLPGWPVQVVSVPKVAVLLELVLVNLM